MSKGNSQEQNQRQNDGQSVYLEAFERWKAKSEIGAPKRPLSEVLPECWAAFHALETVNEGLDKESFTAGFLAAEGYRTIGDHEGQLLTTEGAKKLLKAIFGEKDEGEDE